MGSYIPLDIMPQPGDVAAVPQPEPQRDLRAESLTRQELARRACEEVGIPWPETIVPEGEAFIESGIDALHARKREHEALPTVAQGAPAIVAALKAEERKDFTVKVSDLMVRDDGRIIRKVSAGNGVPGLGYSDHAFDQLVARALPERPRGLAGTLRWLSPRERAEILNPRLISDDTVVLRTALAHNGRRYMRATLSESYTSFTDLDIMGLLAQLSTPGLHYGSGSSIGQYRMIYTPGSSESRIELLTMTDVPIPDLRVGDVHRLGKVISNSETAQGAVDLMLMLIRLRCYNASEAIGESEGVLNLRHIGDLARIQRRFVRALLHVDESLKPLVEAISHSARVRLPEREPQVIMLEVAKKYGHSTERAQTWAEVYGRSYSESPTLWGLSGAITEAAQGMPWAEQAREQRTAAQVQRIGVAA